MTRLTIETGSDNPILRSQAKRIDKFDASLRSLAADMLENILDEYVVGLAAPQIGKSIRMIAVKLDCELPKPRLLLMVNPEIVYASQESELGEEGCLSLPKKYDQVRRAKEITVTFQDLRGREEIVKLQDFNARVVQHEIDHLNGVLFIDKIEHPLFAAPPGQAKKQAI